MSRRDVSSIEELTNTVKQYADNAKQAKQLAPALHASRSSVEAIGGMYLNVI